MGILLEIILFVIIEIIIPVVTDFLVALGFKGIGDSFKDYKITNRYTAIMGCIIIGAFFGVISYYIYPKRIFDTNSFYGISLIISPIVVGFSAKILGERRVELNKKISIFLTFWGGATFAFSYSLIRFLLIF